MKKILRDLFGIFPSGGGHGRAGHGGGRDPAAGHERSSDWAGGAWRECERLPEAGGGDDEVAIGAGDRRRRHRGRRARDGCAEAVRRVGEEDRSERDGRWMGV